MMAPKLWKKKKNKTEKRKRKTGQKQNPKSEIQTFEVSSQKL